MEKEITKAELNQFEIQELEPRLEMGRWSAFARSEQDHLTGTAQVQGGVRLTF